jgi:cell division protein ZapA (FtsZ GTPase activity inhibitor)
VGGQRLRLTAHGNEHHLEALAALVNQRVDDLHRSAKGATPSTLLALAALDLADEALASRRRAEEAQREAAQAIAAAEARAAAIEQSSRQAIAEALAEIDRALADDAASMQPARESA